MGRVMLVACNHVCPGIKTFFAGSRPQEVLVLKVVQLALVLGRPSHPLVD